MTRFVKELVISLIIFDVTAALLISHSHLLIEITPFTAVAS